MKYIIKRASIRDDSKPIKNCKREKVRRTENSYFKSVKEYDTMLGGLCGKWYDIGYGHHINQKGELVRYVDEYKWTVEFNSLEELNDFVEEQDIGIVMTHNADNEPTIVIYDDYLDF